MSDFDFEYFNSLIDSIFYTHPEVVKPTAEQKEKLCHLSKLLLAENKKYNLTAIRTIEGVVSKHLFDSICVSSYIKSGANVIDIGSGAGFPALPLAIMRPDLSITPLDSTEKKVEYIRSTAASLGLANVHPICTRAEELATDPAYRETFDVAIARSVAALPILSELCIPFVACGGHFLSMKSASASEEIESSLSGIKKLGGGEIKISTLYIDQTDGERCLFVVKKERSTPKDLPRRYSQIKKRPL